MSQKQIKRARRQKQKKQWVEQVEKQTLGIRAILLANWKFLVGLCVGVILLYANSLKGDFVSDDYAAITQNPMVKNFSFSAMGHLPSLSNWFWAVIFGIDSPIPFHVFSLVLYLLVCGLVFIFLSLLFDRKIAIFSTTVFAVLPIHVEAVSWISGRPYLLNTASVLLVLIVWWKFLMTQQKKYLYWLVPTLILAFFSARVRMVAAFLLAIWMVTVFEDRIKVKFNLFKIVIFGLIGIAIIAVMIYPLIISRIGSVNSGYNKSGSIFYNPFFQYPTAVTKYLQLLFVPIDLTLYHTMYVFPTWLNWAILIMYLVVLGYSFFKDKKVAFALGFIFLAAAPSMAPVKVSWLVAERYMTLGSVGFGLFLGILISRLTKRSALVGPVVLGGLVVIYGIRVFARNIDWQTNHKLWVNTCQVSPNSHNAWNNIGDDYDKLKDYENAIKGFAQSVVVKPNYADAYHNRANIYYKIGRLDLARQTYATALKYSPGLFQTYFSLTQIDLVEKRFDLALEHAGKAVELQPGNPQTWYVMGVVLAESSSLDEARAAFKKALTINPTYQPARQALTKIDETKQ